MKLHRKRQVVSWLLIVAVSALCLFNEMFFAAFALIVLLRPDFLSKEMSGAVESRYSTLAIFGACYAAIVGVVLLALTLLLNQQLASWIGLSILYVAFWPFVLILALNEYRMFREEPNNALQPKCEDARG